MLRSSPLTSTADGVKVLSPSCPIAATTSASPSARFTAADSNTSPVSATAGAGAGDTAQPGRGGGILKPKRRPRLRGVHNYNCQQSLPRCGTDKPATQGQGPLCSIMQNHLCFSAETGGKQSTPAVRPSPSVSCSCRGAPKAPDTDTCSPSTHTHTMSVSPTATCTSSPPGCACCLHNQQAASHPAQATAASHECMPEACCWGTPAHGTQRNKTHPKPTYPKTS